LTEEELLCLVWTMHTRTLAIHLVLLTVYLDPPPPQHLDIFKGAPIRLPNPLSDQFRVRVCSCPLCI